MLIVRALGLDQPEHVRIRFCLFPDEISGRIPFLVPDENPVDILSLKDELSFGVPSPVFPIDCSVKD
jgi:hypothetical protein